MNRLRVLLLTISILMLAASRLPGQFGQPTPQPQQGVPWYGQVVACNDGTISFSVARAHLDPGLLNYQWEVAGWYNVDPGKCTEIGERERYHTSLFGKDPVTLLAFTFYDSTGKWGGVRLSSVDSGLRASNLQFCVLPTDGFGYARVSPGGDLPRVCDGGQSGYQMIPASFEYTGGVTAPGMYDPPDKEELHVKLGPNDRAIPLGKQTSSGAAAEGPGTNEEFQAVLTDTIRGPGAQRLRGSPAGSFVQVCVLPAVVKRQSWANPQSARTKALKDAIRQFTASHSFSGGGKARFSVREISDRFTVEEVTACSDDDDDFNLQSPQE